MAGNNDGGKAFAAKVDTLADLVKEARTETASLAPFKENPRRLTYALALLDSVVKM